MIHPAESGCRRAALSLAVLLALAAPATAATLQIAGPPGAEVWLDGQSLGLLPLAGPVTVARGAHELVCEAAGHQRYQETILLPEEDSWRLIRVRPTPLRRKYAVTSNILLAGLGQRYMGAGVRGWVYTLAELGGLGVALVAEAERSNLKDDYLLYKDEYDRAINPDVIAYYKEKSDQAYADMKDASDLRDTGFLVAVGAIGVSMLDALLLFPGVDVGPGPVPPSPLAGGAPATVDLAAVHAGVKLNF